MQSIIGIDSRIFLRDVIKRNGVTGHFESVLGVAVKVNDYDSFNKNYRAAIEKAFSENGVEIDYQYYCASDLSDITRKYDILDTFSREISKYVDRIHVFYTLFSKRRLEEVQVYGRMAKNKKIKLAASTRTYEKLISKHLVQCFPAICAWRLTQYLHPKTVLFHLDSYGGHICEAQEELENDGYTRLVFPNGDCSNPVISTADLLLDLIDKRFEIQHKLLIFDNIRGVMPEFGNNLLVYPISNKHLSKITPLEKKPIDTISVIKHPVFWVFKGEELINSITMKTSKAFRNLVDYAASQYGVVKMFESGKDIEYVQEGDFGVYLNTKGKEIIDSYRKLGKKFKPFKLDNMVPTGL